MIQNVVGLFTNPDKAWRSIKAGEMTLGPIYLVHVLVLAAIPAVSAYIGTTQVGWTIGTLEPVKLTQASALQMTRSEEHTSELQSRPHLVCRLLLEKKKQHILS